jgi:chorismate lyase/3-hydroxybenzoate synthase
VVGHASQHVGKPHQQTLETVHNLDALLTHTERLHGVTRGQLQQQALFKVYIRHPEHFVAVRDILDEQLPSHSQVLYLQGEMCRSELLLEVEGILGQEKTIHVSQTESPTRVRHRQPVVSQHEPDSFRRA